MVMLIINALFFSFPFSFIPHLSPPLSNISKLHKVKGNAKKLYGKDEKKYD